jgi:serine/threonine protein kinase/Tol biopolymer transport system component
MMADWDALRELFEGALERPAHERAAYLDAQTNGNDALRREIESLLAAHSDASQFLSQPAFRSPVQQVVSVSESVPRLAQGSRLGAFEILDVLGTGGMGEVYRARDTRLDRFVAIKVLSLEVDTAPRGRERFEREARAISKLSHPRICTIHDIGVADVDGREVAFLVMELLDGETLSTRIARGPLAIDQSLAYAIDIAEALIAAHGQGIVHRDLKPANVMVTSTGVKLLDFGLAQLRSPRGMAGTPSAAEAPLTSAGLVFGTLSYMSPEQLRGETVDARTDVFALGVLLHEMLTGQRPFAAESQAATVAAILEHDAPPISEVQPLASPALDRVVERCLAKNPDDRWQTVRDLKSELIWVREGRTEAPRSRRASHRPVGRRWQPWLLAGVPTVAAIALGVLLWRSQVPAQTPSPARDVTRLSFILPAGITLYIPVNGTSMAIAPDGSRIAFIGANSQGERWLFIHSLDTGRTALVPDTRNAQNPMFSADSQWVAFGQQDIKKVPAGGGPAEELGTAGGQPVRQVIPDERLLTRLVDNEEAHLTPLLVPGGPLLYTSLRGGMLSSLNNISALRPNASEATELVAGATSPQLVGRGVLAFARGRSLYAAGFDSKAIKLTSEPRAMGIDVQTTLLQAGPMYAVARNGTLVYAPPPGGRRLVWVDRSGREEFVNAPEAMYAQLRLSPDGTRVVVSQLDGDRDLWVIDLDGSSRLRVTSGAAVDGMPVWAPDGRTIYFTTAVRKINRVPADGSAPAQTIFRQPPPDRLFATSVTPDGKRLLTHWDTAPVAPRLELRALELGPTPHLTPLFSESGTQADGQLSRDGRWLVYSASEAAWGADKQILVRPFPQTGARRYTVSPDVGYQAIWSHDGREIFYRTQDGTVMSVPVSRGPTPLDLRLGKPIRVVTPVNTIRDWSSGPSYAVSPDGRRFLFIKAPEFDIRSLTVILNWDVEVRTALGLKGQ